jgi:hypothetical protein
MIVVRGMILAKAISTCMADPSIEGAEGFHHQHQK